MYTSSTVGPLPVPHRVASFAKACLLHALYDLKRSLYGPKIILIGVGFILIWGLMLRHVVMNAADFVDQQMTMEGASFILSGIGLQGLTLWPASQLGVFWIFALFLLPWLTIFISADILIHDRNQRRLRFWQLRSHRLSLLYGRMLSKFITLAILMSLALISTLVVIAVQQEDKLAPSLVSAGIMIVCLLVSSLPFMSLMAVVAFFCQTPFRAILLAIIFWVLGSVIINWLATYLEFLRVFDYLVPGSQLTVLRQSSGFDCFALLVLPLVQTVVFVLLASYLWRRADV